MQPPLSKRAEIRGTSGKWYIICISCSRANDGSQECLNERSINIAGASNEHTLMSNDLNSGDSCPSETARLETE